MKPLRSERFGLNSQEFNENRDLWFLASDGWREMACPVAKRKLVLLVPHPDDEIFGCAGLLQEWAQEASETVIVYVTSGEASHGYQNADEQAQLAQIRRLESKEALTALQIGTPVRILELNLPDSKVKSFAVQLEEQLRLELDSNTIVIAPYYDDGHTDHNAVGECAQKLATKIGFELHFYPIWLWFWTAPKPGRSTDTFHKLPMSQAQLSRKAEAIRCFESQIVPRTDREAIIPEEFLRHYRSLPFEVLVH